MKRFGHATALLAVLSFLVVAAWGWAVTPLVLPAGARDAARQIDKGALAGPVRMLADDLLEGRGPRVAATCWPGRTSRVCSSCSGCSPARRAAAGNSVSRSSVSRRRRPRRGLSGNLYKLNLLITY